MKQPKIVYHCPNPACPKDEDEGEELFFETPLAAQKCCLPPAYFLCQLCCQPFPDMAAANNCCEESKTAEGAQQ